MGRVLDGAPEPNRALNRADYASLSVLDSVSARFRPASLAAQSALGGGATSTTR